MRLAPWLFIFIMIASCTSEQKKPAEDIPNPSDTTDIVRNFVYGLWSMDSGNSLINSGFYFRNDGTVDFVGDAYTANWNLLSSDSIEILYSSLNENFKQQYRIDSLNNSRMILSDSDGTYLFRKVPFGLNEAGTVMQGFAGALLPGEEKEYLFDVPAAKKVGLKLVAKDTMITMRIFDGLEELTSVPVREWTTIIIRSGKYKCVVSRPIQDSPIEGSYDIKVMQY